jgi:16S rRNA (uracil1498-N3)-methyltransferase
MAIQQPEEWSAWVRAAAEDEVRWVAEPGGIPLAEAAQSMGPAFRLAIGPEGGWTEEEIEAARDGGWQVIGLGPRILRIETAALALASCVANGRRG